LTGKVNELYDYDENNDNEDHYEPPAKKSDENNNTTQGVSKDSEQSGEVSRFATMNKRFKQKEITGDKIDETLANNITDLFFCLNRLFIVANLLTSPDCSESFETPWVVLLFSSDFLAGGS
jgi:hypothetical protein